MEEKEKQSRVLLAILLAMSCWYAINYFINLTKKPQQNITTQKNTENPNKQENPDSPDNKTTTPQKAPDPKGDANEEKVIQKTKVEKPAVVDPADIKKHYIRTSSYLVEFSSLGGRIEKYYIKNYKSKSGGDVKVAKTPEDSVEFQGQKYQAIEVSRERGFDFNPIQDKNEIPFSRFNKMNFAVSYDETKLSLTYTSPSPDDSYIYEKMYRFFPKENYFLFTVKITNQTNGDLVLGSQESPFLLRGFSSLGPLAPREQMDERHKMHYFRFYYQDGLEDSIDGTTTDGFFSNFFGSDSGADKRFKIVKKSDEKIDFLGSGSRYFIAVLDPLKHQPGGVLIDNRKENTTGVLSLYDNLIIKQGESKDYQYAAYVGIREADGMAFRDSKLDPEQSKTSPFVGLSDKLNKAFNQGLTTPFRNAIVWLLKKLHAVIPGYGWCIIIFGIAFKVAFYPLNQKQADSMKKMQELKPQIDKLNQKYEKDPAARQQKMMELYRKNNVNPMGGCLPMVVQIPIFIALYTAFSDTIDLWKEPFLWVNDLSEPDTIYKTPAIFGTSGINLNLLPLVMVATQIVQTRLTAVSTDPNQKMMMYFMPLIMLYFFWSMPSGVTLYWTIQNILSIVQQVLTNKFGKNSKAVAKT
ncbi:MAG: membrane protein insertase YidC [Spirochaetota bacterium]